MKRNHRCNYFSNCFSFFCFCFCSFYLEAVLQHKNFEWLCMPKRFHIDISGMMKPVFLFNIIVRGLSSSCTSEISSAAVVAPPKSPFHGIL